jgi:hypothetical protein
VAFWDFAHAEQLIAAGRDAARAWLEAEPLRFRPSWRAALRIQVARAGRRLEKLAAG